MLKTKNNQLLAINSDLMAISYLINDHYQSLGKFYCTNTDQMAQIIEYYRRADDIGYIKRIDAMIGHIESQEGESMAVKQLLQKLTAINHKLLQIVLDLS